MRQPSFQGSREGESLNIYDGQERLTVLLSPAFTNCNVESAFCKIKVAQKKDFSKTRVGITNVNGWPFALSVLHSEVTEQKVIL